MYELYWRERTGAFAPAAVMAELDIPYEGIRVDEDSRRSASFAAKNPMAQIPLLTLPDGSAMTESGAMAMYLAETKSEAGLAPGPDDPMRPHYLRWMSFAQVNLYETVLRCYYSDRYAKDAAAAESVKQAATDRIERLWDMTEAAIQGPFFFGEGFTVLDIYLSMIAAWHAAPPELFKCAPKLGALVAATAARPAAGKIWRDYDMNQRVG